MKKNLVSIIIPVYNAHEFLDKCINSVINQTYKNIELIMINDGSTDNSLEIINSYSKKYKFIHIFDQKNSGAGAARNKGIQHATGDYLLFLDSDDYIDNDYVETLINNIGNNDVLVSGYKKIQNDKYIFTKKPTYDKWSLYKFNSTSCKLYLTKFIKDNNIKYSDKFKIGEDIYFNLSILSNTNKIKSINYAGYNIVVNCNSLTHTSNITKENRKTEMLSLLKNIDKEFGNSKYIYIKMLLFFYLKTSVFHLFTQRYILNKEEYLEEYNTYFNWLDEMNLKHNNKKIGFYFQKGEELSINIICNLFILFKKIGCISLLLFLLRRSNAGQIK